VPLPAVVEPFQPVDDLLVEHEHVAARPGDLTAGFGVQNLDDPDRLVVQDVHLLPEGGESSLHLLAAGSVHGTYLFAEGSVHGAYVFAESRVSGLHLCPHGRKLAPHLLSEMSDLRRQVHQAGIHRLKPDFDRVQPFGQLLQHFDPLFELRDASGEYIRFHRQPVLPAPCRTATRLGAVGSPV